MKWHWFGLSSMHRLQDPLADYFFLQKNGYSAAILDRDDCQSPFWLEYSAWATSLLHTKFRVARARSARVIGIWKCWWLWHCRLIQNGGHHKTSGHVWKPQQTCSSSVLYLLIGTHLNSGVVYCLRDPWADFYALSILRIYANLQNGRQHATEGR